MGDAKRQEDPADSALARAGWQPLLFADRLSRAALLGLQPSWPCAPVRLRVHRNQAFEFVASVLPPFLWFQALSPDIVYGDYDDSLAFPTAGDADVELVWLDYERFAVDDLAGLVVDRVAALRTRTRGPILVVDRPGDAKFNADLTRGLAGVPGARAWAVSSVAEALGDRYRDARAAKITGMPLSDAACLRIARDLGTRWLPPALNPRIKAIALDLDHTLYDGVLGEDGPERIALTPEHSALQRDLLALRESGMFLAILSRNEGADVDALFESRADFPLRPEHLSARSVSWGAKADGIRDIAAALNIAPDAVLLIDDNPGELAQVAAAIPGIRLLHASAPDATRRALATYPGLWGYAAGATDALRLADLAANTERDALAREAHDPVAYLRSLGATLTLALDPRDQVARVHEMSRKTNQFNTALKRYSEADLDAILADPEARIVTMALADRLSDSGIIGFLAAHRAGDRVVVDELCVSCRALGRGIEDIAITEALRRVLTDLPAPAVEFAMVEGPRNAPAREWLARYPVDAASGPPAADLPVTIRWSDE